MSRQKANQFLTRWCRASVYANKIWLLCKSYNRCFRQSKVPQPPMSANQPSLYRETLTFLEIKRKTANALFPLSLPFSFSLPHCSFSPPATAPATKQASTTITLLSREAQALLTAQKPRVVPKVGFGHSLLPTPHSSSRLCCYRHLSSCLAWLWDQLNLIGGPVELQLEPIPFNFFKQTLLASQWKYASLSEPGVCFVKTPDSQT